jgi:hypothetical protein
MACRAVAGAGGFNGRGGRRLRHSSHWRRCRIWPGNSYCASGLARTACQITGFQPPYPFAGLIALWPWNLEQQVALLLVALPARLIAPLTLSALRETRGRSSAAWALALNLLWLVVFLPRDTWVDLIAAMRLSDGIVLAAVLCVPLWTRQRRKWLLVLGAIWCPLTPLLLFSLAYLGHV